MDSTSLKEEIRTFLTETKELAQKYPPEKVESFTYGNLLDLLAYSKGNRSLMDGDEFREKYDKALNTFFSDSSNQGLQPAVISAFKLMLWLKRKSNSPKADINRLNFALRLPSMANAIHSNSGLTAEQKSFALSYIYCGFLESMANVIDEELLLTIFKEAKTDKCDLRKKHIALGDFRQIVQTFEKENDNAELSELINAELRNKLLHFDFSMDAGGTLTYGETVISANDLFEKTKNAGIVLQFFILFYLRIFEAN